MFQTPKTGTTFVAPEEPIDVNQRYLVKVMKLTDLGVSKFPQPTDDPDNPTHRIQWAFRMAHSDGTPVLNVDGDPYEHYDYTSSKTGKSTKAGGKTATSRLWMEALFGHPLEDDEIGPEIANELVGKVAVALLEETEKTSQAGEAYTAIRILRLSPRKPATQVIPDMAAKAAAERKESAEKAQATVAKARTAVAVAEPEAPVERKDLPW